MLTLKLARSGRDPLRVLCLGAHSDDIEIGCGGTLLKILQENANVVVRWVVFSADERREREALASARAFLRRARQRTVLVHHFRDGYFPFGGGEIKDCFETLKTAFSPDLIFTHHRQDLHQDHRVVGDLTWSTFRDHLILEYEIPKYDGDLGSPNVFVHLDKAVGTRKLGYIVRHFRSQHSNRWFSAETFASVLRIRGIESNAPDEFAEAYYCRKMCL